MLNQRLTIKNCYDSHVHFFATGQVCCELSLRDLKSTSDVANLKINKSHYRANWLVGFGWNNYNWNTAALPNRQILDLYFPNEPVFFARVDGHASWVNSAAILELKKLGYDFSVDPIGGRIIRDDLGEPTGMLFDQAHINALMLLPEYSDEQIAQFLIKAGELFNKGGFTHVRDLSMTYRQWKIQKQLTESALVKIYSEAFITVESAEQLDAAYSEFEKCQAHLATYMRIKGLKIFIDGSLGSSTAYISQNYLTEKQNGILIWSAENIKKAIEFCWSKKIEIAIHAIGDEAVHTVAECARAVSAKGLLGKIHIEHAQLVRSETLQLLKPLHITVHMQPCHWLSDQHWIDHKIPHLKQWLFQWEALRKNKIKISFGTDSPIEPPNLMRNYLALVESSNKGILKLQDDWTKYHSSTQLNWGNCVTSITNNQIESVNFNGDVIFFSEN